MQFIDYGTGAAGSITGVTGTVNTYAAMTGTAGSSTVTTALSVSVGDQILLWQTQGTGAGNYELVKVAATGSGTFTADRTLINSYGSGAQAVKSPQYTGGNLSGITAQDWNGTTGGILFLLINGTATQTGNITINGGNGGTAVTPAVGATTGGFRGGDGGSLGAAGKTGEGFNLSSRDVVTTSSTSGEGGGGGLVTGSNPGAGGGAGYGTVGTAGAGSMGNNGSAGSTYGTSSLQQILMGAGGGAGSASSAGAYAGGGGGGGGVIFIIARAFVYSAGTMSVNGGNGGRGDISSADATQGGMGAGGGAGGSILIKTQTATLGTGITANGGTGGVSTRGNSVATGGGGTGGAGRIAVYYLSSYSGTTTPTYTAVQDSSLVGPAGGAFLYNLL